jgi:hypothetical protein
MPLTGLVYPLGKARAGKRKDRRFYGKVVNLSRNRGVGNWREFTTKSTKDTKRNTKKNEV